LETKGKEIEDLHLVSEDRDWELERLRKAVDWLEDWRKHDAKVIYKLELDDKKW